MPTVLPTMGQAWGLDHLIMTVVQTHAPSSSRYVTGPQCPWKSLENEEKSLCMD